MYYRLVLLVGASGSGKTGVLQGLAEALGSSVLNVNAELSGELLGVAPKQRRLQVQEALEQIIAQAQAPVVLDNLELLFDKSFQQDPLRLLRSISRNRAVVASWNGSVNAGRLLYAETSHAEYRNYEAADALLIVGMDGTATIDSVQKKRNKRKAGQP